MNWNSSNVAFFWVPKAFTGLKQTFFRVEVSEQKYLFDPKIGWFDKELHGKKLHFDPNVNWMQKNSAENLTVFNDLDIGSHIIKTATCDIYFIFINSELRSML